jgi:hypothetical protein
LVLAAGCNKELVEDYVVYGNTPPPYDGVSSAALNVFASRVYIDLWGRGPTIEERETFVNAWRDAAGNAEAEDSVLAVMQGTSEYFKNATQLTRTKFLGGTDSLAIEDNINIYANQIALSLLAGDSAMALFLEAPYEALLGLRNAKQDLQNGTIGWGPFLALHIDNTLYMEINMGSENFALATFEHLLLRAPTLYEKDQSVRMIDGFPAFLFLEDGNSRADFVRLMTSGPAFAEGLVLDAFTTFLGRLPNADELASGLNAVGDAADVQALQRYILQTTDYAGF